VVEQQFPLLVAWLASLPHSDDLAAKSFGEPAARYVFIDYRI
jgi:hypothetical protein